jgi:hypothetical protein
LAAAREARIIGGAFIMSAAEPIMTFHFPAAILAGVLLLGAAAHADSAAAPKALPVCIDPTGIDRTQIVDDGTILFHMKDGKIWRNTLPSKCFGLKIEGGFAYDVHGGEICSSLQTIRVLHEGTVCQLGDFTPYVPPVKPNAP